MLYLRELKNTSGSISVQIFTKENGKYKVVKTIGTSYSNENISRLVRLGRQEIDRMLGRVGLFRSSTDTVISEAISNLSNSSVQSVGPELIFGTIYNHIGYNELDVDMFRHLVISRLAYPLSKLKTIEYLYRYRGINISLDSVYRFLDKLSSKYKSKIEEISFNYIKKSFPTLTVVFYDMTTLYFEASDEDDLRKTGYSKDGKHQKPQIFLGLLVNSQGYAISYDIFEGNIHEGHTLIPFLEKTEAKFNLGRPVIVADSGLLSRTNIKKLEEKGYTYIIGARLKNEVGSIKKQILNHSFEKEAILRIKTETGNDLIIHYSDKRAAKDAANRVRGIKRLEKRVSSGKLTKANINNRGYNKFLLMKGKVSIEIDYEKIDSENKWDGLKGYKTNAKLTNEEILDNYRNLWHVERAFRMSKTDLRIRPVYHHVRERIEAHICICFAAYTVYKELERVLKTEESSISVKKANELTHNMYQISYTLPDSKIEKKQLLKMDKQQDEIYQIVKKHFLVL